MFRFPAILPLRSCARLVSAMALACAASVAGADVERTGGPYVPTPQFVVDEMLKFARVGPKDHVIDLGSGDGRIVLTAARCFGASGTGYDIDPELVGEANAKAKKEGFAPRVSFRVEDVRTAPIGEATVLTLYLLPAMNRILQPKLFAELKPGTRIVAHDFDLGDWKADSEAKLDLKEKYETTGSFTSNIYLWTVPAKVAGTWQVTVDRRPGEAVELHLKQQFQKLEGEAVNAGAKTVLRQTRIEGPQVFFEVPVKSGGTGRMFRGRVDGDRIEGDVYIDNDWVKWSATRVGNP